ncbi:hypothetical protein RF11_08593 [Thelohanellus kitauei]|uniref:Uncharacterized protein n=1 Tax=Thelohanellus kitauei TaxID=669202 RepID=A0A0C2MLH1_THEKT|nr:hypothetical protein RF11_08593 [Thelohanellus kitauei]
MLFLSLHQFLIDEGKCHNYDDYTIKQQGTNDFYWLEVFKPAAVHFCTDFSSTATMSTYGRIVIRRVTLLQAVRVVQGSHLLNTHPYPQPTISTLPDRHPFVGNKYMFEDLNIMEKSI